MRDGVGRTSDSTVQAERPLANHFTSPLVFGYQYVSYYSIIHGARRKCLPLSQVINSCRAAPLGTIGST